MELEKLTQKKIMDKARFSARFFVIGLILSATFFLLLIDSFKTYHSEISILVSAKSGAALEKQPQIVKSIAQLPKTLNFYDRLLAQNPDVRDIAVGKTAAQRKAVWDKMISIQQASFDSSVIKIAITSSREADATQLVKKATHTLFNTAAFYYDVKKDIDLRIVDGPITRSQVLGWYWLLFMSVAGGFAVSSILDFIFFGVEKSSKDEINPFVKNFFPDFRKNFRKSVQQNPESLDDLYKNEQAEQPFVFEEKIKSDEKFQEIKKITKELEPSKYPNFPEMPLENRYHAGVPDNLPIAADDSFFMTEETTSAELTQSVLTPLEEELKSEVKKEPTPEELKERLNQLLRGEL